jgi:hypothetical protein
MSSYTLDGSWGPGTITADTDVVIQSGVVITIAPSATIQGGSGNRLRSGGGIGVIDTTSSVIRNSRIEANRNAPSAGYAGRGTLDGQKIWWVAQRDFGTGPFRWVIYEGQGGRLLATSEPFYLPDSAEQWIWIEALSLAP